MVFLKQRVVFGESIFLDVIPLYRADERACYIALPLYICGFVTLGASIQNHLSTGAIIMGWGIAELAIMINTVAICMYLLRFDYSTWTDICQMRTAMTASRNTKAKSAL